MNPLLQIVLTLALVAGGIAVYHVATDDAAPSGQQEGDLVAARDLASLEARVEALENRKPLLRGSFDGEATLVDLSARVKSLEKSPPRMAAGRTEAAGTGAPGSDAPFEAGTEDVAVEGVSALTKAQQKEIQRLVDGAVRERMDSRSSGRMNRALEELGIELTEDQRTKLDAAWSGHMEKAREVFRNARAEGLDREAARAKMGELNQELTQSVAEFMPAGDAESIVGALSTMGRGGPPRGGRGR